MNFKVGDKVLILTDYFTEHGDNSLRKNDIVVIVRGSRGRGIIGKDCWFVNHSDIEKHIKLFHPIKNVLPLP